jgi:hypothetical protein
MPLSSYHAIAHRAPTVRPDGFRAASEIERPRDLPSMSPIL